MGGGGTGKAKVYGRRRRQDDLSSAFGCLRLSPCAAKEEESEEGRGATRDGDGGGAISSNTRLEGDLDPKGAEARGGRRPLAEREGNRRGIPERSRAGSDGRCGEDRGHDGNRSSSSKVRDEGLAGLLSADTVGSSRVIRGRKINGVDAAGPRQLGGSTLGKGAARERAQQIRGVPAATLEHLRPLTGIEGVSCVVQDIERWYDTWSQHCRVSKIAEGSYGSVFRLSDKTAVHQATVGKLMPIRPARGVGSRCDRYTPVLEAAREIRLLEMVSDTEGFVAFRNAEVLTGALPDGLREEYRAFAQKQRTRGGSETFDNGSSYPKHQTWVFIEMEDAGPELEQVLCPTFTGDRLGSIADDEIGALRPRTTRNILWGVASALAAAELRHEFEHRDLHFSNICIKRAPHSPPGAGGNDDDDDDGDGDGDGNGHADCGLAPQASDLEITLIDYTLSRSRLANGTAVARQMRDPDLFTGDGLLQFDIYRWMRDLMTADGASGQVDWRQYRPQTNVLWLWHLMEMLMEQTRRRSGSGGAGGAGGCKRSKQVEGKLLERLQRLWKEMDPRRKGGLAFGSAAELVERMQRGR